MKYFISVLISSIAISANASSTMPNNDPVFYCKDKHYAGLQDTSTKDWMKFASCISDIQGEMRRQKEAEIWEFLKANPRYRVPGQSLNKCFGRPKERALARLETKADGSTMAYYKDKVKECY